MKLFNFAPTTHINNTERHNRWALWLLGVMIIISVVCFGITVRLMYQMYSVRSAANSLSGQLHEYATYNARQTSLQHEYDALKASYAQVTQGERSLCTMGIMMEILFAATKPPVEIQSFSSTCDEISCTIIAPSLAALQQYQDALNTHAGYHVRILRLEYHGTSIHASLIMKPAKNIPAKP